MIKIDFDKKHVKKEAFWLRFHFCQFLVRFSGLFVRPSKKRCIDSFRGVARNTVDDPAPGPLHGVGDESGRFQAPVNHARPPATAIGTRLFGGWLRKLGPTVDDVS